MCQTDEVDVLPYAKEAANEWKWRENGIEDRWGTTTFYADHICHFDI